MCFYMLQELYHKTAGMFQAHAFFYQSHPSVVNKHAPIENVPALFVYKENLHYNFTGESSQERRKTAITVIILRIILHSFNL